MDGEVTTPTTPRCYRHPDRETWVSCGKCGKPLCPDCVKHGPVGVRCDDCLRAPRHDTALTQPERTGLAFALGSLVAVLGTVAALVAGVIGATASPNPLISWLFAILAAWTIWRVVGRAYNRTTARWALALGAVPSLVAGGLMLLMGETLDGMIWAGQFSELMPVLPIWLHLLRGVAVAGIGALLAWCVATQRHYQANLFD